MTFAFPKSSRLLTTAEFKRVFDKRKSTADSLLVIYAAKNDLEKNRLGISVSRKVGNAVVRNRWKRLIRTAFRTNPLATVKHFDIVVVPKRGAALPDYAALEKSFCRLVRLLLSREK
ncbi:MAG: ribonuclease P protein component [Planctomycetaceae bacterium]|nr:ribonuclease P protein component [Planctomycetaceae bacterium]